MGATGYMLYATGTGISAYGDFKGGEQKADAIEDSTQRNNAMSLLDIEYAYEKARTSEEMLRERGAKTRGSAVAAAGSSGFATDSASNLAVLDSIDRSIELDAAVIRRTGDIEARSHKMKIEQGQSNLDAADQVRKSGYLGAYTTMLQGGATSWQMYNMRK